MKLLDVFATRLFTIFWEVVIPVPTVYPIPSTSHDTGWSKETVNCNFSLTDMKNKKNGQTQWFLEVVLMFWGLKRVRWKNSCLSPFCQNWGLAPIWLSHACLRGDENVWRHLALSVSIWLYLFCFFGVWRDVSFDMGDILGCQSCLGVFETHSMRDSVWLEPTHQFDPTLKNKMFFHLTLLRHQNIKTSLSAISKNYWVLQFFLFFVSVREKLQFTVSLDHTSTKLYLTQNFSNCQILPLTPQYT